MSAIAPNPLDLCRTLLAYTAPGTSVAVPHAALAALVELASGGSADRQNAGAEPADVRLSRLYDVAALAARYGRAPATVRQWFADGLFGPPEERRFRGRGYVASVEAVQAFEERTGLIPSTTGPAGPAFASAPETGAAVSQAQSEDPFERPRLLIGGKIRAAARGLRPAARVLAC